MEVLRFRKMVLMMVMMMGKMVKSELHYVGGSRFSWAPNVNMTQWSSQEQFHLSDWLYFGYDKHIYNVLEVNKTSYENCIDTGFIMNITKGGGRDVFKLTEIKTYYFLSGGGFCWNGMKVAINVVDDSVSDFLSFAPSQSPFPPPKFNHASSDASGFQIYQTLMVFTLVLMWSILFI